MKIEEIPLLQVGSYLMPDGGRDGSAIRLIEANDKGFRFRRCNQYYNGEEFFLNQETLVKSNWVFVPIGTQLELL
jgi:hypothetical protein